MHSVIPAKAGIQGCKRRALAPWIPDQVRDDGCGEGGLEAGHADRRLSNRAAPQPSAAPITTASGLPETPTHSPACQLENSTAITTPVTMPLKIRIDLGIVVIFHGLICKGVLESGHWPLSLALSPKGEREPEAPSPLGEGVGGGGHPRNPDTTSSNRVKTPSILSITSKFENLITVYP